MGHLLAGKSAGRELKMVGPLSLEMSLNYLIEMPCCLKTRRVTRLVQRSTAVANDWRAAVEWKRNTLK